MLQVRRMFIWGHSDYLGRYYENKFLGGNVLLLDLGTAYMDLFNVKLIKLYF